MCKNKEELEIKYREFSKLSKDITFKLEEVVDMFEELLQIKEELTRKGFSPTAEQEEALTEYQERLDTCIDYLKNI